MSLRTTLIRLGKSVLFLTCSAKQDKAKYVPCKTLLMFCRIKKLLCFVIFSVQCHFESLIVHLKLQHLGMDRAVKQEQKSKSLLLLQATIKK